jgi:hypothetical protein
MTRPFIPAGAYVLMGDLGWPRGRSSVDNLSLLQFDNALDPGKYRRTFKLLDFAWIELAR